MEREREKRKREVAWLWRQIEREVLTKANGVGAATGILRVNELQLFFYKQENK